MRCCYGYVFKKIIYSKSYCNTIKSWLIATVAASNNFYDFCVQFALNPMFYFYIYLFTHTGVQHDFHIRLCSCNSTVTRGMAHAPLCRAGNANPSCRSIFGFLCNVLQIVCVFLSFFCWQLYCLVFNLQHLI